MTNANKTEHYLVPKHLMRRWDDESNRRFGGQDAFWAAVRGHRHFDDAYLPFEALTRKQGTETYSVIFELRDEPENTHDEWAVAVYIRGKKCGYIASSLCWSVHPAVAFIRSGGSQCLAYGRISYSLEDTSYHRVRDFTPFREVYIHLHEIDDDGLPYFDYKDLEPEFEALWQALPISVRDQICSDRFRLTEETTHAIMEYRHLAPRAAIPLQADASSLWTMNRFLKKKREEDDERRHQEYLKWKKEYDALLEKGVVAYLEGRTYKDAAELVGVRPADLSKEVRNRGLKPSDRARQPERGIAADPAKVALIIEHFRNGMSRAQIGRLLGCSATTVTKILSRHGLSDADRLVQPSYTHLRDLELENEVVTAFQSGGAKKKLARDFQISPTRVRNILRRHGLF